MPEERLQLGNEKVHRVSLYLQCVINIYINLHSVMDICLFCLGRHFALEQRHAALEAVQKPRLASFGP